MITPSFFLSCTEIVIRKDPDGCWRVSRVYGKGDDRVKWKCPGCNIFIFFPSNRTPLAGTEVRGNSSATASIRKDAQGYYVYSAMIQEKSGEMHVVEGNSPPDMVIE